MTIDSRDIQRDDDGLPVIDRRISWSWYLHCVASTARLNKLERSIHFTEKGRHERYAAIDEERKALNLHLSLPKSWHQSPVRRIGNDKHRPRFRRMG